MRINVILNTTARLYRTSPDRIAIARRLCEGRAELHTTSSLHELKAACDRIASEGSDLVVLSGGDGSFMAGVTALTAAFRAHASPSSASPSSASPSSASPTSTSPSSAASSDSERLPKIALLPGGTVATVARNWGFTGDPAPHLARILDAPSALKTAPRPTLRVLSSVGSSLGGSTTEEHIGFIFGTGLVASFFEVYREQGAAGYAGAARIVARVFVESIIGGPLARRVLDPLPCALSVEGQKLPPDAWSLICASVVKDLGIHMLVNYRAAERFDRPHLVASPLPPHRLGPRAPLVLAGRSIGGEGHFDDLVSEFAVRFDPDGPFVLDGDTLRATEVRVTAGPTLNVVLPPSSR